jgi:hypothetical protein
MAQFHERFPSPPGLWATRQFDPVDPPIAVLIVDDDEALSAALSRGTLCGIRCLRISHLAFHSARATAAHLFATGSSRAVNGRTGADTK